MKKEDNNLAKQILISQKKSSFKGDWLQIVTNDLKELCIEKAHEEIAQMSKLKFKRIVNIAVKKAALKFLSDHMEKLHKGKEIAYTTLKTQDYLKSGNGLNSTDMKDIFKMRSRNIFVKTNFPNMFNDDKCVVNLCTGKDDQKHIFECTHLKTNKFSVDNVKYEEIFSNEVSKLKSIKTKFM